MTAATPGDPPGPDDPARPEACPDDPARPEACPDDPARPEARPARYEEAFVIADALGVHGSTCVCPRCAGRLPFLLRDLARAIEAGAVDGARPAGR